MEDEKKHELLLEYCYKEYKNQEDRKNHTDEKASYIIVFASVIIGYFISSFPIKEFIMDFRIEGYEFFEYSLKLIVILGYLTAFVTCIISIYFFVSVLINKNYKRIDQESLVGKKEIKKDYIDILQELNEAYYNSVKYNTEINDKIMNNYKAGMVLFLISLTSTAVIGMIINWR